MALTHSPPDFARLYDSPPGLGRLKTVNHKPVGMRFMVTALVFFVLGGIEALLIRTQLAVPESGLIDPQTYNELFTMHGTTMMFLFAVPFLEGIAGYLLPLMFGTRDLPFPRLNAFNYWCYLFGGMLLYASIPFGLMPDGGWFAYPPLTGLEIRPDMSIDFYLLGVTFVEVAAIGAAIEIIILVLKMRPPGMSLARIPLFGWAMLVTAFMIVFAFTPLVGGTIMLELDRKLGTTFFAATDGGDPLLWQHIFWFFGHPEVYIMFLPAAGIVSMIIPVFCRRPIAGYTWLVAATVATGFISFGLWIHHMYAVGLPMLTLLFFAAASFVIAIPNGVQVFAWLATMSTGRIVWRTPLLYVIGFLVTFVAGGITGVMVASVGFDLQVHDTYFIVAHFHYVLVGGVVFPILAALYYWFPKFTGRMYSERWGRISFILAFTGFNVAFFPQHILGLIGMPRRVYTYQEGLGWERDNMLSTIGAFILAAGLLITFANLIASRRFGAASGPNPWGADSLEWSVASPAPAYNFHSVPVVAGGNPIWDDPQPGEMYRRSEAEPWGLTEYPREWRATLATSMVEARPQHIVHLPAPTIWPLVAAVGLLVFLVGVLLDAYLLLPAGGLVFGVGVFAWVLDDEKIAVPDADVEATGLPLHTTGGRSVQWMGSLLGVVVAATLLGTFVSSYLYLRAHDVPWPPAGLVTPSWGVPALATAFLVAALAPAGWAALSRGDSRRVIAGLASACVLALVHVALLAWHLARTAEAMSPADHAYAGLTFVIPSLHICFVVVTLALSVVPLVRAWRAPLRPRVHMLTDNAALWWLFVAASSVVVFAVVHIGPRVL